MSQLLEERTFNRLPPHSVETEMLLLGSLMLGCMDRPAISDAMAMVSEDDFFQADHSIIFKVIKRLYQSERPPQASIVLQELDRGQILHEVGGQDYLMDIIGSVPHYALATQYAASIREMSILRNIISISNDAQRHAYGPSGDDSAVNYCRKLADKYSTLASEQTIDPVIKLIDAAFKVGGRRNAPGVRRVCTGIDALDTLTGGLAKSKMTLVAADPRVGKSALIKQILLNIARKGVPVGLVTIEEDEEKVAENMLAQQARIPNNAIAHGRLTARQWDEIDDATIALNMPYFIDDKQSHINDVVVAIERMATKYKCEVVAVDHLHLITVDAQNREREVSKISKALKAAFKRCNVSGIVACQLNRGSDAKTKPTLKNLRDSGNLEADGDCVMLLWRGDVINYQEDGFVPTNTIDVNIAKNKDGAMGEMTLVCNMPLQYIGQKIEKDVFE